MGSRGRSLSELRRVNRSIWILGAGLSLLIVGLTLRGLFADNTDLTRLANQSQVIGVALAAVGAIMGVVRWLSGRFEATHDLDQWSQELAQEVGRIERKNRLALIGGVHNADLRFGKAEDGQASELASWFIDTALRKPLKLSSIAEYYKAAGPNGRLVILGDPGAGKTLSAITLVLQLLKDLDGTRGPVPVRFSLASWNPGLAGEEWLARQLASDYGIPPVVGAKLIAAGRVTPVLDGLDEMDGDLGVGGSLDRALAALEWLNEDFVLGDDYAPAVVTCRAKQYRTLRERGKVVHGAKEVSLLELSVADIRAHVDKVFAYAEDRRLQWHPVLDRLDETDFSAIRSVLSTPWRLTLAITLVKDGRSPDTLLRPKAGESSEETGARVGDELLAGYIPAATRLASKREDPAIKRGATYDPVVVQRWLGELARRLVRDDGGSGTHAVIDISPAGVFAGRGAQRTIHGLTAAGLVAVAALVIAFDSIGSPQEWLAATRVFATPGGRILDKVVQDILPAMALLGVPLIAWRRSAVKEPVLKVKTTDERRYLSRVRAALRYCVFGALAAASILVAFSLWQMFWDSDIGGSIFVILMLMAGVYALLLWMRVRLGRLVSVGLCVGVITTMVLCIDTRDYDELLTILLPWAVFNALVFALFLESTFRLTRSPGIGGVLSRFGKHPLAYSAVLVAAGVPFLLFTSLLQAEPSAGAEFVLGTHFRLYADMFVPLGLAAGLFGGMMAAIHRGSVSDGIVTGFAMLTCVGLTSSVAVDTDYLTWEYCWTVGVIVLGGVISSFVLAWLLKTPAGKEDLRTARLALRDDLQSGISTALLIALPVFIVCGLGIGGVFGLDGISLGGGAIAAVALGAGFGLVGNRAWYRYRVGLAVAAVKGQLPRRLIDFMDWAVAAGLLRGSGSSYQFRHLHLQQWLLVADEARGAEEQQAEQLA